MKERPILMTPENAQKCHEGTKTQTRRLNYLGYFNQNPDNWTVKGLLGFPGFQCPYGVVGDRLWVREAWALWREGFDRSEHVIYRGGMTDREGNDFSQPDLIGLSKWYPSIHMPRKFCRTVLEITEVRVERLKDISPADALAEGVFCPEIGYAQYGDRAPVMQYGFLWESIHGVGSWALNPWVWVIAFRKVG